MTETTPQDGDPPPARTPPPAASPKARIRDFAEIADWPGYFQAVRDAEAGPRETLVDALDRFEADGQTSGFAIDLGCGEGRDTLELLERGWTVLAIDSHPEAFDWLDERVPSDHRARLRAVKGDFETLTFPQEPAIDLLNASFALPFCPPLAFDRLWSLITASIRPGGRFAGQFFGDRHPWASIPERSHHTRAEVESLLAGMDVELFDEAESAESETNDPKNRWHMFNIVARKPA